MLHSNYYRDLSNQNLNRILNNHNDMLQVSQLDKFILSTEKAWEDIQPSLISLSIGIKTKKVMYAIRPRWLKNPNRYQLQSTMLNYYTRQRLKRNGVSFTK